MTILIFLGIYLLGVIVARGVILADFYNDTIRVVNEWGWQDDIEWIRERNAVDRKFINGFQFVSWIGLFIHIIAGRKYGAILTGFTLK